MEIKLLKISELNEATYNPRITTDKTKVQLEQSIQRFGMLGNIVVNKRNMTIISGHKRIAALKTLGQEEAPCVLVDLDEADEKRLNLAMNNRSKRQDTGKLRDLVKEIELATPNADLTAAGLTADDKANLLAPIEVPETDAFARIPDTDEPDDTQMSFTLSKAQKARVLEALNKAQEKLNTPKTDKVEESLGHALAAISKIYVNDKPSPTNQAVQDSRAAGNDSELQPE